MMPTFRRIRQKKKVMIEKYSLMNELTSASCYNQISRIYVNIGSFDYLPAHNCMP